jgi:hypothetical protein
MDTHIDVKVRLDQRCVDWLREIARLADVTPDQAASVIFALDIWNGKQMLPPPPKTEGE